MSLSSVESDRSTGKSRRVECPMDRLNNVIKGVLAGWGLRELLRSTGGGRYQNLIRQLKYPYELSVVDYRTAGQCLGELKAFLKLGEWGERICLIDADTGRVIRKCHSRSAGHLDHSISESGQLLVFGFSKNGIFVRNAEIVRKRGKETARPLEAYLSEITQVKGNEHQDHWLYLNTQEAAWFRSMALEQTETKSGIEMRDLSTGKAFPASIQFQDDDAKGSVCPRRLKIIEDRAEAADYENIIACVQKQLEEKLWTGAVKFHQ
jgi:hypothetical protein